LFYFLSLIFGERRKFETGRVIMIGMKLFHGGAYELALKMNYNNPDIFWAHGDILKFDKSVMDVWIMNYCATNRRYFDHEKMPPNIRRVFEKMLKDWGYHLTNKVVLFIDNIWRFLIGVVPSGALETSHLDSFVLLCYFCFYVLVVILEHPELEEVIMEFFNEGFIRIIIYGDDHVWCAPKILRGVINVEGWAKFLKNYCRCVLRDYEEYDNFLSTPDLWTGTLVKKGPKFCKRYFILNTTSPELAPVLPFKPLYEPMLRVFVNVNQEPVDYLLSIIGHMWDTMGTNKVHYDLLLQFYHSINSDLKVKSVLEIYEEERKKPEKRVKLNRIVRKLGLSAETIFKNVPSYEKIRKRNVYEPNKCKFGIDTYDNDTMDLLLVDVENFEFV